MPRPSRGTLVVGAGAVVAVALLVTVAATTGASPSHRSAGPAASHPGPSASHPGPASSRPGPAATSVSAAGGTAGAEATTDAGTLVTRVIPGTTSHFAARPALIWTPPAARADPALRFPVLELLIGEPGSPRDWVTRGGLEQRLTAVAAAHDGRAPVVVVVDENGTRTTDTECVATSHGDVERYLSVDVPHWIDAHLPVAAGRRNHAIGGLSEGGTCSLLLALRHPALWATFDDISGLARPTLGSDDDEQRTVADLFHGSTAAFRAHDPIRLLKRNRYATTAGELYYGDADAKIVRDVATLRPLLARAGVRTRVRSSSGGHSWPVFGAGLSSFLSWWPGG